MRLIGLWTEPQDIDSFEYEYLGSHVPLIGTLDGMQAVKTSRCIDGPYYRMTEVAFRSVDDLNEALKTPAGLTVLERAGNLTEKYGNRLDVLVVVDNG